MKTNRTIRFNPQHLAEAEDLGINVSAICRAALELELLLHSNPTLAGKRRDSFILNFFKMREMPFQKELAEFLRDRWGK